MRRVQADTRTVCFAGACRIRHPDSGFTLVETLVALAIIATMAAVSVLALSRSDGVADPRAEALRLATQLESAVDTALTASSRFMLETRAEGYAIHAAPKLGNESAPFAARDFPAAIRLTAQGPDAVAIGGTFAQPFTAQLRGKSEAWTIRFDGLTVSVSDTMGGNADARN